MVQKLTVLIICEFYNNDGGLIACHLLSEHIKEYEVVLLFLLLFSIFSLCSLNKHSVLYVSSNESLLIKIFL